MPDVEIELNDMSLLKKQLNYLLAYDRRLIFKKYKRMIIGFACITAFALTLSFIDADSIVSLKAVTYVLTAFALVIAVIIFSIEFFKWQSRIDWKKEHLKRAAEYNSYIFGFDTDRLKFITHTYQSELKWDYYKYFAEHEQNLFIIPEANLYQCVFFHMDELGADNYASLKSICEQKLVQYSIS
jgi:hypothetical protein